MRKRLNIKLLAGLVLGSFFFILAVYLLHGFQVRRNAKGLLVRAQKHRDEGDLKETVRIMRRYLQHVPDDAEQFKQTALDAKGHLLDTAGRREQVEKPVMDLAIFLMEEAVRKNGEDYELRREAADLWFLLKRFDYAIDNLESIPEGERTAEDQLLIIDSLRLSGGPNEEVAIEKLQKMLGWDSEAEEFVSDKAEYPDLLNAYASLAQLYLSTRFDRDLAEQTANQLVAANPDNHEAYLLRSRLIRYISQDEVGRQKAYADIEQAYSMNPDSVDSLLEMAKMHMEQGKSEEAKQLVVQGLEQAEGRGEKSRLYNMLTTIAIRGEDADEALSVIEQGLAEVPHDTDLTWTKARLLLDRKDYDKVEGMYRELERSMISEPMIRYLQARIMMDKGDYLTATKWLARIRPLISSRLLQYDIDVYLSAGYAKTGQLDLRLATVKRLLEVNPENISAHENMIVTLNLLNRNQEALAYLRDLMTNLNRENKPIPTTLRNLETVLDMNVTIDGAIGEVDEVDLARIKRKVTEIWRNEEIEETRRRAIVIDLFRKLDRPAEARTWIRDGLEKDPSSFGLWALALDFAEDADEARATMAQMEKVFAEDHDLALRLMRARLAIKYDRESALEVIEQQVQDVEKLTQEEQSQLYYELGTLQLALQNRNEGVRLLELASSKNPKRLDIVSALYDEAKRGTDPERVNEIVKRIEAITTTDDDTWRMAEAGRIVWLLNRGQVGERQQAAALSRARQLVQLVRSNRPEWLPAFIEQARIHSLAGDADAAIASLTSAHNLQPTNPQIIRMIAQSFSDIGDPEAAREWMAKLPLAMRSSNDNRAALSLLWQRRDSWSPADVESALKLVDLVVPETSQRAMDVVWRSQVFMKAQKYQLAETAAQRAKELEHGRAEVWTNLISILKEQGKLAEAAAAIQEAEFQLPEGDKPIVLGRCYMILGNHNLAQRNFANALRNDPDNTGIKRLLAQSLLIGKQVDSARKYIEDILDDAITEEGQADVTWARQRLAAMLADENVYASFNTALELIEKNAVNGELSPQDLALWLLLCSRRPEKQSWDRAIIRLEQVAQKRPLSDQELFMKAAILEKYGEQHWSQVKEITQQVLARDADNSARIEEWVKWLVKRGELDLAKTWAANNLDPKSVIRVNVDVHDLAKRGESNEAASRLKALIPVNLDSIDSIRQLISIAGIAEELGQYDKRFYALAEQQYQRVQEKVPPLVLLLARSRGLNSDDPAKISKAINLCITASQKGASKAESTTVALAILRQHPDQWKSGLASAIQSLERWLDQSIAAAPDDLALKWQVASYYDLIGNLDRVETEYQELMDSPGLSPIDRGVVMNNLAYAMALNGKEDRPLELITEAEQLLGPTADLIDTRGYIHLVRGDIGRAITDFRKAIDSGGNTGPKFFHLALALDKQGNSTEAGNAWKSALQAGLNKGMIHPALHDEFDGLAGTYGVTPIAANL